MRTQQRGTAAASHSPEVGQVGAIGCLHPFVRSPSYPASTVSMSVQPTTRVCPPAGDSCDGEEATAFLAANTIVAAAAALMTDRFGSLNSQRPPLHPLRLQRDLLVQPRARLLLQRAPELLREPLRVNHPLQEGPVPAEEVDAVAHLLGHERADDGPQVRHHGGLVEDVDACGGRRTEGVVAGRRETPAVKAGKRFDLLAMLRWSGAPLRR